MKTNKTNLLLYITFLVINTLGKILNTSKYTSVFNYTTGEIYIDQNCTIMLFDICFKNCLKLYSVVNSTLNLCTRVFDRLTLSKKELVNIAALRTFSCFPLNKLLITDKNGPLSEQYNAPKRDQSQQKAN